MDPQPTQPTPLTPVQSGSPRALSLDALRGLAVFGMMFAGVIPWDGLPGWMYHAQERPPTHDYNPNLPGISWVDLVFPFFLFAMGAAIPLAHRLKPSETSEGETVRVLLRAIGRGLVLVAFAVFNQHARPYVLANSPTTSTWLWGLLGFVIPFAILVRLPSRWAPSAVIGVRLVGFLGGVALLSGAKYPDGSGFRLDRADPIILVLAGVYTFGTILWWFTRARLALRVGVLGLIVALRVAAMTPGTPWAAVWNWSTPFGLFQFSFLGYLTLCIPGTMVGDWLAERTEGGLGVVPAMFRIAVWVAALTVLVSVLTVFFVRTLPFGLIWTPLAVLVLLLWRFRDDVDAVLLKIGGWGAICLAIGVVLEPFQGGIKKDPPTLSYGFAAAGLACFVLLSLLLWEQTKPKSAPIKFCALTGQNPLLAYQALTNLVAPLWAMAIAPWLIDLTPGTAWGLARALLQTLLLGLVVALFTNRKLFMRA